MSVGRKGGKEERNEWIKEGTMSSKSKKGRKEKKENEK